MLTQASDYRYCTPIAAGIKGSVLPMVDGTAAARVNRYEDVAFLVEAVRERYHWDGGKRYANNHACSGLETDGVVALRGSRGLGDSGHFGDLVWWFAIGLETFGQESPVVLNWRSLVAKDWDDGLTGSSFPVISIPDDPSTGRPTQSSLQLLLANAAIARSSASFYPDVPRIVEGDSIRAMYSDVAKMERFVFNDVLVPLHNVQFDDTTFNAQDGSWMVALQTDNRSDFYTPRLAWFASSGSYYNDYPGTLTFYIRKPFVVNALTQTRYYSTGTVYPVFHLTYTTEDSQGNWHFFETSAIFRIVNVSVDPVSSANFEGSFTIDMSSSRMQGYIGLIMQKLQQSPLVTGSIQSIGITLLDICFDPGNIALPSTVQANI